MSKDLFKSKKLCKKCGKEIVDGEAYIAIAEDFNVGVDNAVDLLTKSYKWTTIHNPDAPSRVKTVCLPNNTNNRIEDM